MKPVDHINSDKVSFKVASYVNNNVASESIGSTEELSAARPTCPAPVTGQIGHNLISGVSSPGKRSAMNSLLKGLFYGCLVEVAPELHQSPK